MDVLVVVDFNEDLNTKNIQYFIDEIGLHDVFSDFMKWKKTIEMETLNMELST